MNFDLEILCYLYVLHVQRKKCIKSKGYNIFCYTSRMNGRHNTVMNGLHIYIYA